MLPEESQLSFQTGPLRNGLFLRGFATVQYDAVSLKDLETQSCQCFEVLSFRRLFSANKIHKRPRYKNRMSIFSLMRNMTFSLNCPCSYARLESSVAHVSYSFSLTLSTWLQQFSCFLFHQQVLPHYSVVCKHTIISPMLIENLFRSYNPLQVAPHLSDSSLSKTPYRSDP